MRFLEPVGLLRRPVGRINSTPLHSRPLPRDVCGKSRVHCGRMGAENRSALGIEKRWQWTECDIFRISTRPFQDHGFSIGLSILRLPSGGNGPLVPRETELSLEDLDNTLITVSEIGPAVVCNVEALLVTKEPESATQWLLRFRNKAWKNNLITPVVIRVEKLGNSQSGVIDLREVDFSDQSLISRLLH